MPDIKPLIEESIAAEGAPMPSWDTALERLKNEPGTAWLATVRPNGRPHVMPVGAIWLDGAFYFNTGPPPRVRAGTWRASRTASSRWSAQGSIWSSRARRSR